MDVLGGWVGYWVDFLVGLSGFFEWAWVRFLGGRWVGFRVGCWMGLSVVFGWGFEWGLSGFWVSLSGCWMRLVWVLNRFGWISEWALGGFWVGFEWVLGGFWVGFELVFEWVWMGFKWFLSGFHVGYWVCLLSGAQKTYSITHMKTTQKPFKTHSHSLKNQFETHPKTT
jgi:hypothetical protein